MIPLTLAKSGEVMKIMKVTGKGEVRRHLENLGALAGEEITVISELAGNIIVNIRGTRIALDQSIASHIMLMK